MEAVPLGCGGSTVRFRREIHWLEHGQVVCFLGLSCRIGEGNRMDNDVLVSILKVHENRAYESITAPKDVTIHCYRMAVMPDS